MLALWNDLHDARILWELVVLAAAFTIAAFVRRVLRPRFYGSDDGSRFGLGDLRGLQMPLTAVAVVLAGRAALKVWHSSVDLLNVAVPLLTALAIVRVVIYALRRAVAPGGRLRALERVVILTVWKIGRAHV